MQEASQATRCICYRMASQFFSDILGPTWLITEDEFGRKPFQA